MNNLTFLRTYSIGAWKTANSVGTIDIIENPNTSKLFFDTDNGIRGAVSTCEGDLAISSVRGDNGEEFWLIHAKAAGNVKRSL